MQRFFNHAQDPVSCGTHTIGAVAAGLGGFLFLIRAVWEGAPVLSLAAAMCFCLSMVLLPQPKGTRFCLILWGVAIAGVLLKLLWIRAPRVVSTLIYLFMGWAVLFVWKDFQTLGQPCITLVALGGISYSVGAVFYAIKKPTISAQWTFHELFHLLILAGSFFHYLAVFFYVL